MIVGEHTRDNDLEINILKGKQLTNIRTTSKDEAVRLTPPIQMTLEKALAYIEDDETGRGDPESRSGVQDYRLANGRVLPGARVSRTHHLTTLLSHTLVRERQRASL